MKLIQKNLSSRQGMSLVEVMVAAAIFTMLGLSTTAVFIQNYRTITAFRYRTHATNTALNVLEQLRMQQYTTVKGYYDSAYKKDVPLPTIPVLVADPTAGTVDGYQPLALKINIVDDKTPLDQSWTYVDLPVEDTPAAPKVHARFWTSMKANLTTKAPIVEVLEIAVVYQWKNPAAFGSQAWQSSTIRMAMPNPNPKT